MDIAKNNMLYILYYILKIKMSFECNNANQHGSIISTAFQKT